MNKTQLILTIADNAGVSQRVAERLFNATVKSISDALSAGDAVKITGFGTFSAVQRAARSARNVKTGERILVGAKIVPVFKASKSLKDRVNKVQTICEKEV